MKHMPPSTILVTGATGYIGGTVAVRLVAAGHRVIGLTRSPGSADALAGLGIEPLVGRLDTRSPLFAAAREADGVVNAADADDPFAVATLLEALSGSGKPFIHTSGSSIVADKAAGAYAAPVHDEDGLPPPALGKIGRTEIDRVVLAAAADGVRSAVVCPTMIYGRGLGLKADSIQVPMLRRLAEAAGVGRHIGTGENVWSNVHIEDLADLYLLALADAPAGTFLFAENGEASLRDIARAVAEGSGLRQPPEPMDQDEAIIELGAEAAVFALGSNSRVRARRARDTLGWRPTHDSLLDDARIRRTAEVAH